MKYLLFEMNYYKNHFQFTQNQIKAIRWSQENGKCFGAGTNNWSDSNFLIIPFNKLKSNDPVLVISEVLDSEIIDSIMSIKLATEQIAIAYQHLLQKQKTAYAEAQAHEEAIKSALLASIAHDMRTPLTSILGAATTLNQDEISFNKVEIKHLTAIITSQAKHLARTNRKYTLADPLRIDVKRYHRDGHSVTGGNSGDSGRLISIPARTNTAVY